MTKYFPPTIDQLLAKLDYLSEDGRALVRLAYDFAAKQHEGQFRSSGDPYITHPLAVCDILADLRSDAETIAAGMLHDVVEDCGCPPETIEALFGTKVRDLVIGVTKLSKQTARELEPTDSHGGTVPGPASSNGGSRPSTPSRQEEWAENMRQLFMSSVEHPLILVIKLADRLHNMRTLDAIENKDKRKRIAQETMDIFAPVANRLGMWQIKWELEDLAFRHLEPELYDQLKKKIAQRRRGRERFVKRVIEMIEKDCREAGIEVEVSGRPKHIYSIWRKMMRKGIPFEEVYDIHGFRVITKSVTDCYTVLGLVHTRWTPIPGEFDDYIARPKENGYQSLHTAVIGPGGVHMEVQIRTREMHEMAEQGVAAHWRYKEGGGRYDAEFANKVAWLRALVSYEEETKDATEMVESLRTDLFGDRVYVFTPKGDLLSLPSGSTPIDFAYYIHTEVGHRCRGARVNGKMVRLDYKLQNRDRVEIITAKRGGPSRDWLNPHLGYVRTSRARSKIRAWFRKQKREQNIVAGKQALDRLLKQHKLRSVSYEEIAQVFDFENVDDLFAAIGYGDISTERIAGRLITLKQREAEEEEPPPDLQSLIPEIAVPPRARPGDEVTVRGVEGLLTRMAQCCNPLPGEPIVGYITRGRGITIHRADCKNILNRNEPERLIQVEWGFETPTYSVPIIVKAWNRAGLLRDVTSVVAANGINISSTTTQTNKKSPFASMILTIDVKDAEQLTRVMHQIERVPNVFSVERLRV
ncbi:MAG: bifunctional (p)ppGpp synthetase/guanosine-3',5'-bis(diphosphate) 3'-pyrophosphohydrolase [Caldilineae bacterium]|nr:MAG: bifunctional (p)ppGpp synthetase/guanosine-3',5'-bis(diphosphate) 3'-pyrophosphohydrolase [Caldilineae bacterium]